jgi:type II secretory pathway component GspD/PulD (secretin)
VTGTTLATAPPAEMPGDERSASGSSAKSATGGKEPRAPLPETRVLRLAHAPAKETAAVLAKSGDALDVSVSADPASNSLVITGLQPGLGRVLKVLGDLDRPRRRIHLEAKIVEVTRSARLDLGVEWKLTGTTVGGDVKFPPNVSDAGSAALVIATKGAAMLDARISALEADGRLHVVSRPSVEMLEGSPATIESVRILRIRLPSNGTVVGDEVVAAPSSGRATEDIPVGVRLEVTPAIRGGSRVLLRIRAKSSNLGAPLPPDDIPEELSRMVDAEVLVGDGETAVLGGLMREAGQNSDAGVPGLRRAPLFGGLFGKKSKVGAEEELLVLVTPRVLD